MTTTTVWYATKTSGKFQEGRFYTKEELGVLGRMAAHVGILVPMEQSKPIVGDRAAKAAGRTVRPRKRRGVADAKTPVQAGGSPDLRDDSGA